MKPRTRTRPRSWHCIVALTFCYFNSNNFHPPSINDQYITRVIHLYNIITILTMLTQSQSLSNVNSLHNYVHAQYTVHLRSDCQMPFCFQLQLKFRCIQLLYTVRDVDPYGTGGDTSPQYLDWGDIITNVPLNISRVISATFYPCNILLISSFDNFVAVAWNDP